FFPRMTKFVICFIGILENKCLTFIVNNNYLRLSYATGWTSKFELLEKAPPVVLDLNSIFFIYLYVTKVKDTLIFV
ncbi:hypothetical protein L9F63_006877, partial [Diploptera punctata]